MSYQNESFYLDYPYNLLKDIGIENPTQDQLNGLNYVISKLDEKSKEILYFRYKNKLAFVNIGRRYDVSRQAAYDKVNRVLKKLSSSDYIRYGYEGYYNMLRDITLKNEKNKKAREKLEFEELYKRVMLKQEKNKENIEKIRMFLFDIKTLPIEYKEVSIYYRGDSYIGDCFSVRAFNCLLRAGFYNLYDLLVKIYENPLYIYKIRNLGRCCFVEIFSILYNLTYITEEQLTFLYLYYNLKCDRVNNFEELKNFYLKNRR